MVKGMLDDIESMLLYNPRILANANVVIMYLIIQQCSIIIKRHTSIYQLENCVITVVGNKQL